MLGGCNALEKILKTIAVKDVCRDRESKDTKNNQQSKNKLMQSCKAN